MIVVVSGGFDPIHVGHVRLIREAKKLGEMLVVILNNDKFLLRKKGFIFMPQDCRAEILRSMKGVDDVHISNDEDDTVCEALRYVKPNIFANGADRQFANREESKVCQEIGCEEVFGVGGYDKIDSSSWIVERFVSNMLDSDLFLEERS